MLIICPTPIGNLDDVTVRQRSALSEADVVACEDTRRTGKLLERLGIDRSDGVPRLVAHHEYNEGDASERLGRALRRGRDVVLVSDAGTPLISDPGYELVRLAVRESVEVRSLPGPSAALVALTASGLPAHAFQFRGFPPETAERRREFLLDIDGEELTTVLYESPGRLADLIADVAGALGEEREVCVGRELTKVHEEYLRGPAGEVLEELRSRERIRGECTVVIGPAPEEVSDEWQEADRKIEELLDKELRARTIKEIVSELYDVPRSELYDRIQRLDDE